MNLGYVLFLLTAGLQSLMAQDINLGDGPILVNGGGGGGGGIGVANVGLPTNNRPTTLGNNINNAPPVVTNTAGVVGGNQVGVPNLTPSSGSGSVLVVDDTGTIIPSSGTSTTNNNNNNNNVNNNNINNIPVNNNNNNINNNNINNNDNNNNIPGGDFNSFGPANFPSFGSFGSSGSNSNNRPNFPGYDNTPSNTFNNNFGDSNNNVINNNNNNNNNVPGGSSFFGGGGNFPSSSFPTFGGNGNSNPNPNLPSTNTNVPSLPTGGGGGRGGFPDLGSINLDFGFGSGGNSGFPPNFGEGAEFFPGLPGGGSSNFPRPGGGGGANGGGGGGINLPPINPSNPGSGFGSSACQPPSITNLDAQFSGDEAPVVVTNGIIQEASVRPEVLALANFFGTLVGNTQFVPPSDDPMQSCPANYTRLTKFVTSSNLECWLLPPPYQEPVYFANCRCAQCQDTKSPLSRYGGYNNINLNNNSACGPQLTNVTLVSYCPLLNPARIVPFRLEVPTSCRCQKTTPTNAGPYNFRNN